MPEKRVDLVLEGGGMRGLGLIGALQVLDAAGYRWVNLAGTSAGSIVASLLAAGASLDEVTQLSLQTRFSDLLDPARRWLPRLLRNAVNLYANWGVCRGDVFEAWMAEQLAAYGVRTFADLSGHIRDRKSFSRLRVVASDIGRGRMLVLPDDLPDYGIDPMTFSVARAVRMSVSIPLVFRPIRLEGTISTLVVDGGLLSNYPIGLFDDAANAIRPTIGIRISTPEPVVPALPGSLLGFVVSMMRAASGALDRRDLERLHTVRTIAVDPGDAGLIDFAMSLDQKTRLLNRGCAAARAYLTAQTARN